MTDWALCMSREESASRDSSVSVRSGTVVTPLRSASSCCARRGLKRQTIPKWSMGMSPSSGLSRTSTPRSRPKKDTSSSVFNCRPRVTPPVSILEASRACASFVVRSGSARETSSSLARATCNCSFAFSLTSWLPAWASSFATSCKFWRTSFTPASLSSAFCNCSSKRSLSASSSLDCSAALVCSAAFVCGDCGESPASSCACSWFMASASFA
mmetsp:Transcript_63721/g.149651  ORF Transcript_63721/g.149651 Transcript_63721/m.149651 type:complete len:213 (-) Transcript_63721:600-1238(-)